MWVRSPGWEDPLQKEMASVQLLSRIRLFATPWTAAHQASLSITNSLSLLKLMMPSNHLILCRPLLLLPSIFPSIRVFSNELFASGGQSIGIRWPKKWLPTPVFLLGELHGQRSLEDYSSWGCRESDTTEQQTLSLFTSKLNIEPLEATFWPLDSVMT